MYGTSHVEHHFDNILYMQTLTASQYTSITMEVFLFFFHKQYKAVGVTSLAEGNGCAADVVPPLGVNVARVWDTQFQVHLRDFTHIDESP